MDNKEIKSDRPPCPYCGSNKILKNGSTHHKKQKYLCKECGRQFIENPQKKTISESDKKRFKNLLLERISLRGIGRILEISLSSVQKFVNKLYLSISCELKVIEIKNPEIIIECDELWSYVNSKENPVYIWLAIERKSGQVIAIYFGDRSENSCQEFWNSIPDYYKENAKFYSDLWQPYQQVIPPEKHYPSNKKSGETTKIERFNNTLRQRCSRLVRKTLSYSKSFFNHEAAIIYFILHYNEELLST